MGTELEKPALEKIVARLENLDIEQWEWKEGCYGPEFITRISGLTFYVSKHQNHGMFIDKYYHSLSVQNRDRSVIIQYSDEQRVSEFYEKLYNALKKSREKEFKQMFDEFLSE